MLPNVLASARADAVSIEVVRVFVRLRQILAANADLAKCLDDLQTGSYNALRITRSSCGPSSMPSGS